MQAADYQPRLSLWSHVWRYALVLVISGMAWAEMARWQWNHDRAWFALDLVLGLAGLVLVALRRRFPVAVATVLNGLSAVSGSIAGPATLALVSLATRRQLREIIPVGLLSLGCEFRPRPYRPHE